MIHIQKAENAKEVSEHAVSSFREYALPFNSVSVGVSSIHGRYPETGFDVDKEIEQVWYVESGEGTIETEGGLNPIALHDMVHIPKNTPYAITGNELVLVVSSSPPWSSNQHIHIP